MRQNMLYMHKRLPFINIYAMNISSTLFIYVYTIIFPTIVIVRYTVHSIITEKML